METIINLPKKLKDLIQLNLYPTMFRSREGYTNDFIQKAMKNSKIDNIKYLMEVKKVNNNFLLIGDN
ncbi:MAG: hypothetical protein PHF86_01465 [Candidatus Nanoarchaeia archaeon]|nr:hypothetical protein [Candidatus Nanoarchaeia archaeon]